MNDQQNLRLVTNEDIESGENRTRRTVQKKDTKTEFKFDRDERYLLDHSSIHRVLYARYPDLYVAYVLAEREVGKITNGRAGIEFVIQILNSNPNSDPDGQLRGAFRTESNELIEVLRRVMTERDDAFERLLNVGV